MAGADTGKPPKERGIVPNVLSNLRAHAGTWTGVVGVFIGAFALLASCQQLEASNRIAWDYDGGSQCSDFRGEVLDLWNEGMTADQIRKWFEGEAGGAQNEYGATTDNALAIDDFEDNCGTIEQLLKTLPTRTEAG